MSTASPTARALLRLPRWRALTHCLCVCSYIKYDSCSQVHPEDELFRYFTMRDALNATGRPMICKSTSTILPRAGIPLRSYHCVTQTQFAPGRAPATEHQERLTPTSGCRRMRVCCVGTTGLRAPSPTQRCAAATTLIRVPAPTVRRMRRLRARTSAAKRAARRAPTLAKIAGEVSTATSPVLKTNLNRSHKLKECRNFFLQGWALRPAISLPTGARSTAWWMPTLHTTAAALLGLAIGRYQTH